MSEICDVGYAQLAATSESFIRLETLREANARVSDAVAKLPIFKEYDPTFRT
jgi:hypothetical protein